jgi:hypothetical protein
MVKVGLPFAIQYLNETFEQAGEADEIITSIDTNSLPVLADQAKTVFEVFSPAKIK